MFDQVLILVLLASGAWMTAISWFVGSVHYPGFRSVAPAEWDDYHVRHTQGIGPIVALPMIAQVVATALLCLDPEVDPALKAGVLLCAAFSIGWTGLISGPLHMNLKQDPPDRLNRLISTNWVRTLAWAILTALSGFALLTS